MDRRIAAALKAIADRNGGRITAKEVLAEATLISSPLHAYFEARGCFDMARAQREYGIIIARELIRSVRVEVHTIEYTVLAPQYIRDPSVEKKEQGYASLQRLRTDVDVARDAVIAEFVRACAALTRAKAIAAALNLSAEVEALRAGLDAFSSGLSGSDGDGDGAPPPH